MASKKTRGKKVVEISTRSASSEIDNEEVEAKRAFGRRLLQAMRERGWNQSELARRCDIGRDSVSNYVNGKVMPSRSTIILMADKLGMPVKELRVGGDAWMFEENKAPLEIRMGDNPERVSISVNQEVSLEVATEIMQLLRQDK